MVGAAAFAIVSAAIAVAGAVSKGVASNVKNEKALKANREATMKSYAQDVSDSRERMGDAKDATKDAVYNRTKQREAEDKNYLAQSASLRNAKSKANNALIKDAVSNTDSMGTTITPLAGLDRTNPRQRRTGL